MTIDASAPDLVVAANERLLLCASWIAAIGDPGNEAERSHYPDADKDADLPLALFGPESASLQPRAVGGARVGSGTFSIMLFFAVAKARATPAEIAEAEATAEAICGEYIEGHLTGILATSAQWERAAEPVDGDDNDETSSDISILITIDYGVE
jgi:hypothetical protein